MIALATVVIGRREAGLSARLLVPPCLTAVAWSAWALSQMQAAAWAAALTLPLTQKPAWFLALGVFALGLPWSPFIVLAASRSVRVGWSPAARTLCLGWFQVAAACLVVGTVVPGLAAAARMPAVAGLAVVAAACVHRVWVGPVAPAVRRGFLALAGSVVGFWLVLVNVAGIFLASSVPYYRGLAIALIGLSLLIGLVCLVALFRGDVRRGLLVLTAVAVCLKVAHWGYYVPEWNYRHGQGPWGRAIGQWVVPDWPIYTVHAWPRASPSPPSTRSGSCATPRASPSRTVLRPGSSCCSTPSSSTGRRPPPRSSRSPPFRTIADPPACWRGPPARSPGRCSSGTVKTMSASAE